MTSRQTARVTTQDIRDHVFEIFFGLAQCRSWIGSSRDCARERLNLRCYHRIGCSFANERVQFEWIRVLLAMMRDIVSSALLLGVHTIFTRSSEASSCPIAVSAR
jgi:hypothetical protein